MKLLNIFILAGCFLLVSCGTDDAQTTQASQTTKSIRGVSYPVSGTVVKGPLANAKVEIYIIDPLQPGFKGKLVSRGTTTAEAVLSGLKLRGPLQDGYIVEVSAITGSIDINTGQLPTITRLKGIVTSDQLMNSQAVSITPLTTLATEAGILNSASTVSVAEVIQNIYSSAATTIQSFGFGLDSAIDIFTVQALVSDDGYSLYDIAAYRTAVESVTALVEMLNDLSLSNSNEILNALAVDMLDGNIDGISGSVPVAALSDVVNLEALLDKTAISLLVIPNTDKDGDPLTADPYTVDEVELLLVAESSILGVLRDLTALIDGSISIIPVPYSTDTDSDGIPDLIDSDIDNDGVLNADDVFPYDSSEWSDLDSDGVGDNADAYQNDSNCSILSEGNGTSCYVTILGSARISDVFVDQNDIAYLYVAEWSRILRFDLLTQQYLLSVSVGQLSAPSKIAYSVDHHRIYLGYTDGQITYIDLAGELIENSFAQLPLSVNGLASVGRYMLAQDPSGAWATHYIYDQNGVLTDSAEWNYFSRVYQWNEANSRVYFFRDSQSPNDLHYEEINQLTGLITASGESPYHGAYQIIPPIKIAQDGSKVLLGSGDVYDANDLTRLGSVGGSLSDAMWLPDGELVTTRAVAAQSVLERREANLNTIIEQVVFDGVVLGLYEFGTRYVVVTQTSSGVSFNAYQPNDDSDSDGVLNLVDAFPLDPAASVDTDNDGYPDSWNLGYSEIDSTTGLVVDAYPDDSACYLLQHGDGVQCDYTSTMPLFTPDVIETDSDGTAYLLSNENNRIFRWSSITNAYTNPLYVGSTDVLGAKSPTRMTYSEAQQRIYLGYSSGEITFIDLATSDEHAFASLPLSVNGLIAVGNYVMAQDSSGAWNTHYVFDAGGALTDSAEWNYFSTAYAWNEVNNRAYFFRDGSSPNDLHYEEIDQLTGLISASGETPYHGDYQIISPIRVSVDGGKVLLGSGDLYDANTLTWLGALGTNISDAVWQADGSLILIKASLNQTLLERRDPSLNTVLESLQFAGQPLAIYAYSNKYIVVTEDATGLIFNTYQSTDDTDGDGVLNLQDAFPLDPAASVDTDNDGYPDSWNTGYTSVDSTTGLTIDSYPEDSACYLLAHGDGVLCDYTATMPVFTPDVVEIDESGTVYMLSTDNNRIFRWSASTSSFTNPIYVGSTDIISAASPTKMTYSAAHQRLYLAYSSGSITYVDLSGSSVEQTFANIPLAVNGLVSVGNYVMAQDSSGAWNTHYVFDANGVLTDSADWNYFSREYAWNAVTNRVYFFRDSTSPNDLHFEEVDQTSGLISSAGETPYHGTYSILSPILFSQDGSNVMLGSGDVYDASTLGWLANAGAGFVDAVWFGDVLVMANNAAEIQLRDATDFTILSQYAISGTTHSLLAYGEDVVRVYSDINGVGLTIEPIGDHDGDGLPAWWELTYGLNDADPADASLDTDGDGLINSVEYVNSSSPIMVDTDSDGITDADEVNVYFTSPSLADTDSDGLSDGYEILISFSSPLLVDTDVDGFTDGDEVNLYGTDPTDAASIPAAITSSNESFEAGVIPGGWVDTITSNASWVIDSTQVSTGAFSLRSGAIVNNGQSGVQYTALFAAGTLSFSARVDAEACCDKLKFYVDGVLVHNISSNTVWANYQAILTSGEHTLEWRYYKDSSVSTGADSAWIDDVAFQAN